MHSLPSTSSATKCVALKHKRPLRLKPLSPAAPAQMDTNATTAQRPRVDDDLLATVLRVALETKLRRERLRQRPHAARVLQQAVAALDEEPAVSEQLTTHKAQFGFRDAIGQLGRLRHHY